LGVADGWIYFQEEYTSRRKTNLDCGENYCGEYNYFGFWRCPIQCSVTVPGEIYRVRIDGSDKQAVMFFTDGVANHSSDDNPAQPTEYDTTESTTTQTEETTQPTEHDDTSDTPQINADLLADLWLSFAEIRERRGEVVGIAPCSGGFRYVFENGYGEYAWSDMCVDFVDEPWGSIVPIGNWCVDTVTQSPLMVVREESICGIIYGIPMSAVFVDLDFPVTVCDIEEFFSLSHVESFLCRDTVGYFSSQFSYESMDIRILTTRTKETIDIEEHEGANGCNCGLAEPWVLDDCTCVRKEFSDMLMSQLIFDENSIVSVVLRR
jgi:hypothetical protein